MVYQADGQVFVEAVLLGRLLMMKQRKEKPANLCRPVGQTTWVSSIFSPLLVRLLVTDLKTLQGRQNPVFIQLSYEDI